MISPNCTELLRVPEIYLVFSSLRAFAHTVPSTWNVLLLPPPFLIAWQAVFSMFADHFQESVHDISSCLCFHSILCKPPRLLHCVVTSLDYELCENTNGLFPLSFFMLCTELNEFNCHNDFARTC